ncbi:hypothetical protein [Nocardioides sp.]|uniref:hypothetical protein n=1 Tax=Nocardioides sp. TaxID=35761 RepID=UPI0035642EBA
MLVGLITIAWGAEDKAADLPVVVAPTPADPPVVVAPTPADPSVVVAPDEPAAADELERRRTALPSGGQQIFGDGRFLVAYYGTAGTGALGVLGETDPATMHRRVRRAARPFRGPRRPVQVVHELIVTIADRVPGPDGDYSHDITRRQVRRHIEAAHEHGALLVLDLQPGRSDFLTVAKRWAWALRDPWVGLALDPEWRMAPGQVPGRVIGSVSAREINRTTRWLADLTRRHRLPQKLVLLHQFRTSMIRDIARVSSRARLATVQHVDGFGTQREKLATYHAVKRPQQFLMGMKLFYDEDHDRMGAREIHRIRPRVRFVSYQ